MSLMQRIYRWVARLVSLPVLMWLWIRGRKEPAYRQNLIERLGFVSPEPSVLGGLWIHAASVGEVRAALTLWPALQAQWGAHAVTWTTQTPAGRDLLIQLTHGQIRPFYAPMDTPGSTRRFLQRTQPRMLLLMERELWPEWLWQCEKLSITVSVVNARLTQRSATSWPHTAPWFRNRLQGIHQVLCADSGSTLRFELLGVNRNRLKTTGNLKFDLPDPDTAPLDLAHQLKGRTVIVAACTHEGDENEIRKGWVSFAAKHPEVLLVLTPRHPQRFETVAQQWQDFPMVRRSSLEPVEANKKLLLLDTMGELPRWYTNASICLMGGTWSPVGGHNALESLAAGCPVFFGPHTEQFPELYTAMAHCGAAKQIDGAAIWAEVELFLSRSSEQTAMRTAAKAFVTSQQGAADFTLNALSLNACWPKTPMKPVGVYGTVEDRIWADAASSQGITSAAFSPNTYKENAEHLATGSGRGQALRVQSGDQHWVLRHYRRGGWIARFNPDRYSGMSVTLSRAMREFTLLREMRSIGLPVPRPVAARFISVNRSFVSYRADILVECIDNSLNFAQWLDKQTLPSNIWKALGKTIKQLHEHGIDHTDLNCHNLLLDDKAQIWIVDFDKCARRSGQLWKKDNLQRLLRSFRKESVRRRNFQWQDSNWEDVVFGYQNEVV